MTSLRTKHNLSDMKLFALCLKIQCRVNTPGSLDNVNLLHARWGHHPTRVTCCIWYKYNLKTWALCSEYGMPQRAHLFEFSTPRHNSAWQAEDVGLLEGRGKLEAGPRGFISQPHFLSTSCFLTASLSFLPPSLLHHDKLCVPSTRKPPWPFPPPALASFHQAFCQIKEKVKQKKKKKNLVLRSQTGVREMVQSS